MSLHIDRTNYEEFYLDYLEGNLSGEALVLFELFLKANPDLVVDEELDVVLPGEETLDPAIKLAMKQATDLSQLSAETLDYFLIAREEGLLTSEQSAQLDHWLIANAQYRNDAKLMALAKLTPSAADVYTAKDDLKRPVGRIIPLPVWIGSVAAAAGIAFLLLFNNGTGNVNQGSTTSLAQKDQRKVETTKDGSSSTTQTTLPATENGDNYLAAVPANTRKHQVVKRNTSTVDQLATRSVSDMGLAGGSLIPLQIEKTSIGDHPTILNDMAVAKTPVSEKPDMANPIVPITNRLSAALNTEVDFRTAKAAKRFAKGKDDTKGFYLKIGKFEVSHRSASR